MELNLIQFNEYMKSIPVKPPKNSDSFYTIKNGEVSLFCEDEDRYVLTIRSGEVYTGEENCYISKQEESLFKELIVKPNASLLVTRGLTIIDSKVNIQGRVNLPTHSRMYVRGKSNVHFTESSIIDLDDNSDIIVEKSASVTISGQVYLGIHRLEAFTEKLNIRLESSSVIHVKDMHRYPDIYTLNSYQEELSKLHITPNSINEKVYNHGKNILGYKWVYGKYEKHYQILDLYIYKGIALLGDLKILFKGIPTEEFLHHTGLRNLYVNKRTELHIVNQYDDKEFLRPKLYIGGYAEGKSVAECHVHGKIICSGKDSSILLDKNGKLFIHEDAEVRIINQADMICDSSNTEMVLQIDGTLIIDYIEQIESFTSNHIAFGKKGKIIILNPSTKERHYLFSTPNQIKTSSLYSILLKNYLDHVEYHINENTGIRIDQYYEFYGRDMKEWFGNKRIEQAIKDKNIIWNNGFIELDHRIISWATMKANVLNILQIFKCFGANDLDRAQNAINRLVYAGCGNILFRLIADTMEKELLLDLSNIDIKNVYYDSIKKKYIIKTDNDGIVFLRNNTYDEKLILSDESKKEFIINKKAVLEI